MPDEYWRPFKQSAIDAWNRRGTAQGTDVQAVDWERKYNIAEADAKRYRWLLENGEEICYRGADGLVYHVRTDANYAPVKPDADKQIDEAIHASKGKEGSE